MSMQMGVIVHKIMSGMRVARRVVRSVAPVNQTGAGASLSIGQTAPAASACTTTGPLGHAPREASAATGFAGRFPWLSGGDDTHCGAVAQPPRLLKKACGITRMSGGGAFAREAAWSEG